MTALALAALAIAAPGLIIIPDPPRTLPKLEPALQWARLVQPDLAPRRLRREAKRFGFDPFDAKSLANIGVDPAARIHIWHLPTAVVIELRVRDTTKADAALKGVLKASPKARALAGGPGFVEGVSDASAMAGARFGRQLFLQVGSRASGLGQDNPLALLAKLAAGSAPEDEKPPPMTPVPLSDSRFAPIRIARSEKKPRAPPAPAADEAKSDIWLRGASNDGRGEGAIWLREKALTLRFVGRAAGARQIAMSELARESAHSWPLFDTQRKLAVAGESTMHLHSTGMRGLGSRYGITGTEVLAGPMHVIWSREGWVAIAAELATKAQPKDVEMFMGRVRHAFGDVKLERTSDRIYGWIGQVTLERLEAAALSSSKERRPAIEVRTDPRRVATTLSKLPPALAIPPTQQFVVELMVGPFFTATKDVKLGLTLKPARALGRLDVAY